MGNCFGLTSAVQPPAVPPGPAGGDDSKVVVEKEKEQPFVTEQVEALRKQAGLYHEKVVHRAKASQQAYQKGDKRKAHTLSEEKKSWQRKRDEANRKAAKCILEPQQWQKFTTIDLHGLHLEEAVDATKKFLKHWSKEASKTESGLHIVLIITGAGHHSEKQAVIRPRVEKILQQQRLEYQSISKGGAFEVILRREQ